MDEPVVKWCMCDPLEISLLHMYMHSFLTKYLLLWTKGYFLFRPQYELWSVFLWFFIKYEIQTTHYIFFFSDVMIMLQYWLDFVHTADHLEISSVTPNLKCLPEVVEQLHQSGQGCEVSRQFPRVFLFKFEQKRMHNPVWLFLPRIFFFYKSAWSSIP